MMSRFPLHDPASAPGRASGLLAGVIERNGDAGDMVRTMAGSPTVLAGYLDLSAAAKRAGLDRRISERIALGGADVDRVREVPRCAHRCCSPFGSELSGDQPRHAGNVSGRPDRCDGRIRAPCAR